MKKIMMILLVLFGLGISGLAQALEFSADVVNMANGRSISGKMYVSQDKVRMEMAGAISITRVDKKIAYVIMPDQKMYMEQPFDPEKVSTATEKMPGELKREFLGGEIVNGRNTKKYKVSYDAEGRTNTVMQWIDDQSGVPVKTASPDDSWSTELRNLRLGQQDMSLFEMPEGYTKFAMPNMAEMMKRAMAGRQSGDNE
jgi:hypothetical protein